MSLSGHKLQELPGNDRCVDCQDCDCDHCGFPDPVWASEELGIVVCEECMSIHQSLTKATFKSVLCQDWTEGSLNSLLATNNNKAKEIYEKKLPLPYRKPTRCYDKTFREQWIISKYVRQDFVDGGPGRQPKYLFGEKRGYMWKRGRDDRIFQRRWFTLDKTGTGSLKYYADSHATPNNLKGEIPLLGLVVSPASEHKIGHPNGLQLMYPETLRNRESSVRIIYIYAEAPKDMVEWYQTIRCLKFILTKHLEPAKDDRTIMQEMGAEVVKEGYLMKTGSTGKGVFRKRWFILDNEKLMYLKRQLDANPISSIRLGSHKDGFSLVQSRGDDGWHFHLKTPGRTYHLVAEDDHNRTGWIRAIHRVCQHLDSCPPHTRAQTTPAAYSRLHTNNSNLSTPNSSTPTSPVHSIVSSASMPLPPIPPHKKDAGLDRSPTVPPRPAPRQFSPKDSIPVNKEHLKGDGSHQQFKEAKKQGAHHQNRHKIFLHKPSDSEDIYLSEDGLADDVKDDSDDDGYLKMEHIQAALGIIDSEEIDGDVEKPEEQQRQEGNNDGYISFEEVQQMKYQLSPKNSLGPGDLLSDDDEDNMSHVSDYEFIEEEEDHYVEFVGEKAILTKKFTKMGDTSKELSVHLRVAPQSLLVDTTLSLSMVWSELPSLPGDSGCVILTPVVSCTGFANKLELLKPLSLEIQHCGVLKDISKTKPKIWCMRKIPGQGQTWEEVQKDDQKVSIRTQERSFIVATKDISAYVVKVPRDDIVGKTTRCVTYTSGDCEGNLNARVYFINDNGSDDALEEVKRREKLYESVLCDISHKFFLANNNDGLKMTLENLEGLQKLVGSSDIVQVSAEDLWEKQITVHNLELTQTAMEGYCTLKVWQENNPRQTQPIELSLRTDTDSDYQFIPGTIAPPEFINPAFPAQDAPQPPAQTMPRKSSSEHRAKSPCGGLERSNPHQHSAPAGRAASSEDEDGRLPFSTKHKLFLLLDTPDPRGNDWRMLAEKLGLGAQIYEMQTAQSPTLEVLQAFEKMDRDVCDLEETLRAMKRSDAADVVSKFIGGNKKHDVSNKQEEE